MEDRWLSVDEVAIYLEIKGDIGYKRIVRNNMPSHKIGCLWKSWEGRSTSGHVQLVLPKMTTKQLNFLHSIETPALETKDVVRSLAR